MALNTLVYWRFWGLGDLAPHSLRDSIAVQTAIAVFTAMNSNAQVPTCFEVDFAVPSKVDCVFRGIVTGDFAEA